MTQFKDIGDCQFFTTGGIKTKLLWYKLSNHRAECLGVMLSTRLGAAKKFVAKDEVQSLEIGP